MRSFSLPKTLAPSPPPSSYPVPSFPIAGCRASSSHSTVIHRSSRSAAALHSAGIAEADPSPSAGPQLTSAGIVSLLREFGFDGEEAEALLQRHGRLAGMCPESLRRRLVSLQSAGIAGLALPLTLAKQPEILTSVDAGRFLDFVEGELGGIDPPKLVRVLTTTEPRALGGVPDRARRLVDHGVPRDKLGHVVNSVNIKKVFCERSSEKLEETVVLLGRIGGCGGEADLVLRRPVLLNLDLETQLVPRIAFLVELAGGDEEAAAKLIRKLPAILAYTVEHFESHLKFWRSVGLSRERVFKIALVYPSVFSVSRERKIVPRIEFLKQCGLDADDIFKFLVKAPLFLSLSLDNLAKKLVFLVKMGYRHGTRDMAAAAGAVTRTSCENLQGVVGLLLGYGFCIGDVLAMSRRHPQLLQYNYESLEEKLEYLVGVMEREVEELLAFPAFLGYKLDDRIKHRYEVTKEVKGKGMSLNKLLSVSTETFYSNTTSNDNEVEE
uniref:mTERF domain-containing protein 3, mitochondrial n=1 Tax=Anthurium amnicola TaxID=1678845 RepID=A0A1D1XRX1_9ARAE